MRFLKRIRRRYWVIAAVSLLVVAVIAITPWVIVTASTVKYRDPQPIPDTPVALVLGAGLAPDGSPSPFLAQRVATGVQLHQQGKVKALLMSGDNSLRSYDEVTAMATLAKSLGVPASAIVLDYAGFDTYSSCYRAKHVWGAQRLTVVTQPSHLPRAVWLCRAMGIDALGVGTGAGDKDATAYGYLREVPGDLVAMTNVITRRKPAFPGPREHTSTRYWRAIPDTTAQATPPGGLLLPDS